MIFLGQLEAHTLGIGVAVFDIVDRHGDAGRVAVLGGDGFAQVGGERGDAALARQVVADESDAIDSGMARAVFHERRISCSQPAWRFPVILGHK